MTRTKGKEERGELRFKQPEEADSLRECSICRCQFDLDMEGGSEGEIGIIPVAFCPTCKAGIFDFVQQSCSRCQGTEDDDD